MEFTCDLAHSVRLLIIIFHQNFENNYIHFGNFSYRNCTERFKSLSVPEITVQKIRKHVLSIGFRQCLLVVSFCLHIVPIMYRFSVSMALVVTATTIEPSSEIRTTCVLMIMLFVQEHPFPVKRVFLYAGEYRQDVQQRFQEQLQETKVLHRNIVRQLIRKFCVTGSVCDATRTERPWILLEGKKRLLILYCILQNPKTSIRKSQQLSALYSMVRTALKNQKNKRTPLKYYSCTWIEILLYLATVSSG